VAQGNHRGNQRSNIELTSLRPSRQKKRGASCTVTQPYGRYVIDHKGRKPSEKKMGGRERTAIPLKNIVLAGENEKRGGNCSARASRVQTKEGTRQSSRVNQKR